MSTLNSVVRAALKPWLLALALLFTTAFVQASPGEVGIVLLHGKWGQPGSMRLLGRELEARGYRVKIPEMPWSGRRLYDKDYPGALQEIQAQAQALRAEGASRVVIAGQSLGANAAAGYAAAGLDADAIALLAPGHFPERGLGGRKGQLSYERAKAALAAGHGADMETFDDFNQGKQRQLKMSVAIYVSYFDPDGAAAMTKSVRSLPKALPVFLAIGTEDPFYPESKAMFESAPSHPGNHYAVLQGDHFAMPNLVAAELLKWLEPLAK